MERWEQCNLIIERTHNPPARGRSDKNVVENEPGRDVWGVLPAKKHVIRLRSNVHRHNDALFQEAEARMPDDVLHAYGAADLEFVLGDFW